MDNAAVMVVAPGVVAPVTVNGSASAQVDVTNYYKIWLKSDVDFYVIFGTLGAVTDPTTVNAMWCTAGLDYVMDLLPTQSAFKVLRKGSVSGTVSYAKAA